MTSKLNPCKVIAKFFPHSVFGIATQGFVIEEHVLIAAKAEVKI